jgi:hypothetical protein
MGRNAQAACDTLVYDVSESVPKLEGIRTFQFPERNFTPSRLLHTGDYFANKTPLTLNHVIWI